MTDSRIIYWCETHEAESHENHGGTTDECWRVVWVPSNEPEGVGNGYALCRIVQRRLVPLEVSEGMVEAAARAMHMRTGKPRGAIEPFILDARAALNAALGGNDE